MAAQGLFTYKQELEPIVLPDQTVHLITASKEYDLKCVAVEPLPAFVHDFGAVTATDWSRDKTIDNLEMPTNELAQIRMKVLDDFRLYMKNPPGQEHWRTNKVQFYLPKWPTEEVVQKFMWAASEHYVWEDEIPEYDLYNPGAVNLTLARVEISGFRYRFTSIPQRGVLVLWASGWPGRGI